jgi:hypothetical protein
MPSLTQFLIFEVGSKCNLGHIHTACPNRSPERFTHLDASRDLDDDTIVAAAVRMHREFGFRGRVGWHYYNEPLLQADRIFRLMDRIKAEVPQARFVLWSNGTLLPADCSRFAVFEEVHITDYSHDGHPPANWQALRTAVPSAKLHRWQLDQRLTIEHQRHDTSPCLRPLTEFIVDCKGNVHLCCYDWKGLASPGNIFKTPLEAIVSNWRHARAAMAGNWMTDDAPEFCKRCALRTPTLSNFVPDVLADQQKWLADLRSRQLDEAEDGKTPAVVFVHYNMPEQRLRDHFAWNDAVYRSSGAAVYVVTDRDRNVPEYATCVLFPGEQLPLVDGKRVFSLSATKNCGIAKAIADGHSPVISTDVDVAFPGDTWQQLAIADHRRAYVPVYRMRTWPDREDAQDHDDPGCTGTVSMTAARWRMIHYNERMIGYGGEDGCLLRDMRSHVRVIRDKQVWHIAHTPGVNPRNVPGKGRDGCWGRDSGFNPDNFENNIKRA